MFHKSSETWLVVGLGNPGTQYQHTRHNTGFRAVDVLAEKLDCKIDKAKFQGLYGQATYNGVKIKLLKPLTYMNLSGLSVLQLSAFFSIPPERIIVMFDDISLEPGRLRIRANGSAGGHNGLKSIIEQLSSEDFPRVKIGVGKKPTTEYNLADWVLGTFPEDDMKKVVSCLEATPDICEKIIAGKIQDAMGLYNKR